jgi:16S rRNA (uracil1498-N3)-methyltransferase
MNRCHIDPADWSESEMIPNADEQHHLTDVLRCKDGEVVVVFDGKGREAKARITVSGHGGPGSRGQQGIVLKVIAVGATSGPELSVTLIQSLPKGTRMDWIVEKAVELGVTEIVPVISERTIVRLDPRGRRARGERWQRLALSASRQCGTKWVPDVRAVCDYMEAVGNCAGAGYDLLLVGSLGADARPLRDVLRNAAKEKIARLGLIIGPEGDLTDDELKAAIDNGATPVSFGQLVLRVETAALYGLSTIVYEFTNGARRA